MSQSMNSVPKRHKRSLKLLFVVPTAALSLAIVAGCSSDPAEPTADATPDTTTSANTSQTSPDGSSVTTNPATGQEQLPAAKPGTPVELGNGVSINATSVTRTNISGQGPGEVGGPAIAVTFAVSNDSGKSVDLTAFNANLFYGKDRTPASPALNADSPFSGELANGQSATATYSFFVPGSANPIEIQASYSAQTPIAIFKGRI